MTERRAVGIVTFLGMIVLVLLLIVCHPFSWGRESEIAVTGTAVSGDAISGSAVSGGTVSGGVFAAGVSMGDNGQYIADAVSGSAIVSGAAVAASEGNTLITRFAVPDGYVRTAADDKSLAAFLRYYPLKKEGSKVKLYDGTYKTNQKAHAAVFKLPLGGDSLQQCADTIMRVYAEYFWQTGQYDKISFHFVDGFEAAYLNWREGKRIQIDSKGRAGWYNGGSYDASYTAFKKYLRIVFAYASTISMKREAKKTTLKKLKIGDIFIEAGSPGHVVMVVDLCENAGGKKAFLLAQGYTPAQQFHVLKNPAHEEDPWYYEDEITYPFKTPEYTFQQDSLMHPNYNDTKK